MTSAAYVGRFAPSPTGLLHFGSLLAAMASYCDARSHNGAWRLRIDDIDPPRALPTATEQFQQTLNTFGFTWDGPVILQSMRTEKYLHKLLQLNNDARLYLCDCSRRKLADQAVYPGYCKPDLMITENRVQNMRRVAAKLNESDNTSAVRVVIDKDVKFNDFIQGGQSLIANVSIGDTVVVRRDDLFAYALACAVDDADGITHVVRGADLLTTSATQIRIMELLGLTVPAYAHIPVAVNSDNQKLSKQTYADPLDTMPVLPTLLRAWHFLGQMQLKVHSVESFWQAAIPAWRLSSVGKHLSASE